MGEFLIPEGAPPPEAPPVDPMAAREEKIADDTRIEQSLNSFLAGKQAALFEAPDAFYRALGEDAFHAAPVATRKLDDLRNDLLDRMGNGYQRQRLGNALDAQMQLTRDGMARHVAEQSLAWQRGVAQDRIALLTKEAAQHHNDTDLVDALGHAAASAARAHSRVGDGPPGGEAEDAAAATARSGVLGAAIQARLDRGDTEGANALFTKVKVDLDPDHALTLGEQIAQSDTPTPGIGDQYRFRSVRGQDAGMTATDAPPSSVGIGPPPGSPEYEKAMNIAVGHPVTLPDGSTIPDDTSPTGKVMSSVSNLAVVAAAGRKAGAEYRALLANPTTASGAILAFGAMLGLALGHGGTFDYQRGPGNSLTGFEQRPWVPKHLQHQCWAVRTTGWFVARRASVHFRPVCRKFFEEQRSKRYLQTRRPNAPLYSARVSVGSRWQVR